ncbi:Stk1 family PASTA domain-containing Ser/Thr kinase [Clostridium tertium]|jgi:eukaryotic-like serine/threonine-protein kinase|uniref:Stk1 family PASTA domain-containing Ser/Thr kinase n=1 Tax=Clostridium TaxID=1485 RepID=UPI00232B671E|nr:MULTISPECIES: Stk1 family PASTA domain-containing Ser/Thr kinase [Clostridium]MDB1921843.1 Stk1 family PASTA domain-containing Ser/Thr kinase [Clostridium tertium]MDB1925372.1 Stk1 family PASTA domain-containing Ser/Thr kinase [Clostridium tertium]MDB1928454.1 Stk1 family PASTA domain-containing Ser/Thr kinase [Clostridium tertium]MDB1968264.1 Stk1 family PASTA domain-containing Ser/Thr kinase [Clostridium tertium]MDU1277086.1 Stk1 family PASTA domain-containing Ser/Thr kinase [Clostridium 
MNGIILGGRYELLEKVGEGGMSEVYKAKCNKLNRFVAVKILKKQFADNKEISQKFKREATAIANLSDTNIVNVLDVGTQEDIDYIVMEYISGKTLKELIYYSGKLSYNTAIKIALQIAKALDCAHRNNIIHRDIKPQNILVTESGEVKVTDFGIAKSTDSQTITNTTSIIGSAHYLSPEQAKGTYIDFRSDIYSFGIVLYEMVTGKLPFEGDSPVTVALKHLQEEPIPPKNINSAIPDSLNKLILKAVEKEPIKRYQNAKEIIQDLQKIQENPDVVIGASVVDNSDHTIIMTPINTQNQKTNHISKLEDDYDEEDDYYEDEDFDDDYDEDEIPKKKKKSKNGVKKAIVAIGVIIGVIILGSVGFFLAGGNKSSKEVEVPNIIGKTIDDVKEEVEKLGLKIEIKSTQNSDKPENTILETDPKAGTKVKKDSAIKVVVSSGEEQVDMPDFRDYEVTNIEQILKNQGLTNYTIIEKYNDKVEKGYFIKQNPAAGTKIGKNTKIEITVSKGPEVKLVNVPNVEGQKEAKGKEVLEKLNLVVTVNYEVTNDKNKDGIILKQSDYDSQRTEGTPITLTVGKYEEKKAENEVINIAGLGLKSGMKVDEATAILLSHDLSYEIDGVGDIVESFTKEIKKGETVRIKAKNSEKPDNTDKPEVNNSNNNANNGNNNGNNQ